MAMALHEPVSVVVPLRMCSSPESMDEKSSESDTSRCNSPRSREEVLSTDIHVPVISNSNDDTPQVNTSPIPPPLMSAKTINNGTTTQKSTLHGSCQLPSKSSQLSLPLATSHAASVSPSTLPHLSSTTTFSTSNAVCSSPPTSQHPQLSVSSKQMRASVTPSQSGEPSPVTSSNSGSSHSTFQPPMLLSQNDVMKGSENNNMLTLSSYVQFMTLQQQGQMGYPALLPSACLPQSAVANPPTTLPPQYDNFSTSYTPSLQSFSTSSKFNGLLPHQLNQGLIALDVPMTTVSQSKPGMNNLGLDQHRFMVGAGALPGHEVARAVGSVGVPLVVAGRSDPGVGAMVGAVDNGGSYKRPRKRSYSQANADVQDGSDMHGYNSTVRRSIFPSEEHCGGQLGETHSTGNGAPMPSTASNGTAPQQLKWQAHQVDTWHDLCDGALQDIPQIGFTVETDKGFVFSIADDTFVCQKKNHFQVTVTTVFHRTPKFIKMKDGSIQPVDKFILQLHGVKLESIGTTIRLEQSMTDRRRSEFTPIEVAVPPTPDEPAKHTVCRLHFGETTANNMRKRGKPNPDQKYFSLVVGLNAVCELGSFPVVVHVSERIIVRASNPGNFDNDCDYLWLKSSTPDSIYHHGRVGINTDKPEEALSVNGNIRVTGRIEHPSDMRIKTHIHPVDSGKQLERVSQLKLYRYQYRDGVMTGAVPSNEEKRLQVGVLAQELRQILPEAVHETNTEVALADGSTVSNLLVIDKDRLLMETIGAVQELKNIADGLNHRLNAIEKQNSCSEVPRECSEKSPVVFAASPAETLSKISIVILSLLCLFLLLLNVSYTRLF